jgi:ankyrin repeat protein
MNIFVSKDGNTPLHDAASRGQLEVMRILLEAGANKDDKNTQVYQRQPKHKH